VLAPLTGFIGRWFALTTALKTGGQKQQHRRCPEDICYRAGTLSFRRAGCFMFSGGIVLGGVFGLSSHR
jgi:hypothetical protein